MADDFPAELERAYHRIEELEQAMDILVQERNGLQREAWWRTYNAALGGLTANSKLADTAAEVMHAAAAGMADNAHGSRSQ